MKTTTILIILLIFASCNDKKQGYWIQNSTYSNMHLSTSEFVYKFTPGQSIRLRTSDEITKDKISFDDMQLKPTLVEIGTSPDRTINVLAYKHHFEVHVFGNADSAIVSVNGEYHKSKIPFYYGDETTNEYYVRTEPLNAIGHTYTYVFIDGVKQERYGHFNNEVGVLTNK